MPIMQASKKFISSFQVSFNFPPTYTVGSFNHFCIFIRACIIPNYQTIVLLYPLNTFNLIVQCFMYIGCIHLINSLVPKQASICCGVWNLGTILVFTSRCQALSLSSRIIVNIYIYLCISLCYQHLYMSMFSHANIHTMYV